MPANWRGDCPHECEVRNSSQRDSAAAGLAHNATLSDLNSGRRVPRAGSCRPKRIKVGGTTERTMCVVCGPGSTPSCQPPPRMAMTSTCAVAASIPGAVAPARSQFSDSTTAERRAWAATRWQHGRARQTCPQPAAVVSDQFVFPAGSASFASAACGAPRKLDRHRDYCWCLARAKHRGLLLLSSATGEASRRIADALAGRSRAAILLILADMRSIAASGIFGRTAVFDGLGSLRPSERMNGKHPAKSASGVRQRMERVQIDESGQRCGGTCRYLARHERKCRLGDAGLFPFPQRGAKRRGFPA